MADIRETIKSRYGIDIAEKEDDIFRLYKITAPDISDADLEKAINDTRSRWTRSINGANEANRERDQARMDQADIYEAILRDKELRRKVFEYKNNGGGDNEKLSFARDYFGLIQTAKKISRTDVDFFCKYYGVTGKEKKAVSRMIEEEFGVHLGKEGKEADDDESRDDSNDTKDKKKNTRIENLFSKDTVLKLREAQDIYEKAGKDPNISALWPDVRMSFYECLVPESGENDEKSGKAEALKKRVTDCGECIYKIIQVRGKNELNSLRDAFNIMESLLEKSDVKNNIEEFILLIKYPNLTPYMFTVVRMKQDTFAGIVDVAQKNYRFINDTDFILNYYLPICDNFGITNDPINFILKKAQKGAKTNKVLRFLDRFRGSQNRRKLSIGAEIIYRLLYWPLFLSYFVFELFRIVFTHMGKAAIPLGVVVMLIYNIAVPKVWVIRNLGYLRKLFVHDDWMAYISEFWGGQVTGGLGTFIMSIAAIAAMLLVYALPPVMVSVFSMKMAENLKKSYDWIGYKRTFEGIIDNVRDNTEKTYFADRKSFVRKKLGGVVVNALCMTLIVVAIILLSRAFM